MKHYKRNTTGCRIPSSCNTCSFLRGWAIYTHSPATHVLTKHDHCSPPTATHQAILSRWETVQYSAQMASIHTSSQGSLGKYLPSWCTSLHLQSRSAVMPAIKVCFYNCKFLNLPCNLRYHLKLENFSCSQFKPRSQRCTVPHHVLRHSATQTHPQTNLNNFSWNLMFPEVLWYQWEADNIFHLIVKHRWTGVLESIKGNVSGNVFLIYYHRVHQT